MDLIATYANAGYEAVADAALAFYERRQDLHRAGSSFGADDGASGADRALDKVSTDISLVAIDPSDPEVHGLAQLILRGVSAGLARYLAERPLLLDCCPENSLFVLPIFNLQRYAPGEGFKSWHCDWTTAEEGTEPIRRVLAWILYLETVPDAGTEFHWQQQHVEAIKGQLAIFPAGISHFHRGRVSHSHTKTIATGWINAGSQEDYLRRLRAEPGG